MKSKTESKAVAEARINLKKAESRARTQRNKLRDADNAESEARALLHAAEIRELIGQPVKRCCRSDYRAELNDRIGTLVACRRTRCTVDFGDLGKWTMPIAEVIAAESERGGELLFDYPAAATEPTSEF